MIASGDPLLVRWGLHELEGSGYVVDNAERGGDKNGDETVIDESQQKSEVAVDPVRYVMPPPRVASTASDALIAQALQEEFQQLAAAEAAGVLGPSAPVDEQVQVSVLAHDWVDKAANSVLTNTGESSHSDHANKVGLESQPIAGGGNYGHVTIYDWDSPDEDMEQGKRGPASSSSLQDHHYELDDDDRQLALALSEDYPQVDKEVARRLTKLESIKHVPKINGSIPTYDDASADHQRLLDRLELYGLTEQKIKGDGNCQFRALSDQLYRTPAHHKYVRKSVVKQLKTTPEVYSNYVPMKYTDYLKNMAKNGEWGDHVTLQAAADYYGVKVSLITSFKDTCFVEIAPTEEKSKREIYLSFWAEVHYNSIYPIGELPTNLDGDYPLGSPDAEFYTNLAEDAVALNSRYNVNSCY